MKMPGFTAEWALLESNEEYSGALFGAIADSNLLIAGLIPARLAIKELPREEARACYHNCRNAGLRPDFCEAACL
jgi:hypothetical protein